MKVGNIDFINITATDVLDQELESLSLSYNPPSLISHMSCVHNYVCRELIPCVYFIMRFRDQVYDMVNTKVGQFIIINNETFVKKDKRKGSEHDVKKLEATFGEVFGFDVTVHEEKTAEEITDIIQTRKRFGLSCVLL